MSPSQVQSKIAQHFGVPVTKLKTYSQANFVVGNKPVIQSVSYGANGESLSVSFTVVSRDPPLLLQPATLPTMSLSLVRTPTA